MGKTVEKKKKGRPSLLDLQKRNLIREQEERQQQQQQKRNSNPNPNFINSIVPPNSNCRPTRRNPNHDEISEALERIEPGEENEVEEEDDDEDERREKKLKFVLRLPTQSSSLSPSYLNSTSYLSVSNLVDVNGENPLNKRKCNALGDGSAHADVEKGELQISTSKAKEIHLGTPLESGPTKPLPDKKLLFFILDRLQKKDTYSVFSEPVDPEELPDYHDIIHNPMDFGTVRKKLEVGAYSNLEQFEKDVYLICSNAMEYNAPDTIYFRQARSIQELAKKNFENLRQECDGNEPQPKRRGRPPKNLKKPPEHVDSEFPSDPAALATGHNTIRSNTYNLRKGPVSGPTDAPGRTSHGSRYSEASWLAEHKSERNDEFPGSVLRGMSMKFGKKQVVLDENRRNTCRPFHQSGGGCEPSVFHTFDGENKQLMPVGLHVGHGYARSLARFAANLGPVAWAIASKKIARTLPAGMNFGPGWVGEKEVPPVQLHLSMSSPPQPLQPQTLALPSLPFSATTAQIAESRGDRLLKQELPDKLASDVLPHSSLASTSTAALSSAVASEAPEPTTERQVSAKGPAYESGYGLMNSSSSGIRPPPLQIHQSPVALNPAVNGFSGGFGYNLAVQMAKMVRPAWQAGNFSSEAPVHSRMPDAVSGSNNLVHPVQPTTRFASEERKPSGTSSITNPSMSLSNSYHEATISGAGIHPQQNWRGSSLQQRPDSVPPDLNVRFQLPGSPSSSVRDDSPQSNLALQM